MNRNSGIIVMSKNERDLTVTYTLRTNELEIMVNDFGNKLDAHVETIKVSFDGVNKRIDDLGASVNKRIDDLDASVKERFNKVDERFDKLETSVNALTTDVTVIKNDIKNIDEKFDKRFDKIEDSIKVIQETGRHYTRTMVTTIIGVVLLQIALPHLISIFNLLSAKL